MVASNAFNLSATLPPTDFRPFMSVGDGVEAGTLGAVSRTCCSASPPRFVSCLDRDDGYVSCQADQAPATTSLDVEFSTAALRLVVASRSLYDSACAISAGDRQI